MAKKNNYWGLVAVGALTAAAAGAVASIILKKSHRGYAAFEDDFEDDYFEDDFSVPENTDSSEAYAQWEEPENTEEGDSEKEEDSLSDPVKEEPAAEEDEKDSAPDTEKDTPKA